MRCSIVIRAYNEEAHIGRLMEGIRHQTVRDVEVILVDSGSTDSTVAIATCYGARVVHIRPKEFTFGRSLNLGLAAATSELVVIASAHVYPVYPDWLECLLEPFADPQVALTYGRQRGPATARFSEQQVFARWYPDQSVGRQTHPFCNNANAAIRRSVWEEHPYDETLTGLEDLAWARAAQATGRAIAYVAEAEIMHVHHETPRGVRNRYRREAMAFKRIFSEAHFNLYDFLRNVISSIGFDLLHAFRQRVLWRSLASIFWFRWNQFLGTYQGYRSASLLTPELRQTFYYHVGWEKDALPKREVEPIRYNE
ncbi:MAG: glycosyltransferase family 2 protein [Anaerolineales bacterium]|nr:glycosyltransferase family 2 protein [Anaerolineales bacterium]